jgi:signal transduction histidine kinase
VIDRLRSFFARPLLPHYHITRRQLLLTALISFSAPLLYLIPGFPFHRGFLDCAVVSGAIHLTLFVFFNRIFPLMTVTLMSLSAINIVLLGFVMHFSGGVTSPFIFFFVSILVSDAVFGIEYPLATISSILTYATVVILEYTGIVAPVPISNLSIYASGFFTAFTLVVSVIFIGLAGFAVKGIMKALRTEIETEHLKKEALMKQLSLLEAPSQVGLLVSKIAHDIRGPLGAIIGFVQLIQSENKLTADSQEDCTIMLAELQRINNLMNRMLTYVRPGQSTRSDMCPTDLIETVLSVMMFYPGARRVTIERQLAPANSLLILANKEELQQVAFNILKNAIEALEATERPRIIVRTGLVNELIEIAVIDNGPGISPAVVRQLTQGRVSTKKDGGGVGLLIANEIVASHGGSLDLSSQLGQGTRLVLRFPPARSTLPERDLRKESKIQSTQ